MNAFSRSQSGLFGQVSGRVSAPNFLSQGYDSDTSSISSMSSTFSNNPPQQVSDELSFGREAAEAESFGEEVSGSLMTTPELGPLAVGAAIGKAAGEGINDIETSSSLVSNQSQFNLNSQQPGIFADSQAKQIQSWNENQIGSIKSAGSMGANFGILGQVIGHAIGESNSTSIPQQELDTVWTANGKIDPMSDNFNITNDASSIPASQMQNGFETSPTSTAEDTSTQ